MKINRCGLDLQITLSHSLYDLLAPTVVVVGEPRGLLEAGMK